MQDREFGFWASGDSGVPEYARWVDTYGFDDIGMSFFASPDVVVGAAFALKTPSAYYRMVTAGLADPSSPIQLADSNETSGFCSGHACIDVLVTNVLNYRVTAVERVIDDYFVEPTGAGTWVIGGKQTIRFWGEFVPEPTTVALTIIGLCGLHIMVVRRH